ncbi:type IV pilus modification PilV family protein [Bdellovibrio sp.]|uniref:type IV pilus modification PilV family protein n=1 Tax=Bdellovibrio sp. TaxID=28201 RepID=UPI0039E2B810
MNVGIFKTQKGISILEVVIALAIFGITVAAIISFQANVYKQSRSILQRSSLIRVVYSVQEDLLKDLESLPFRKNAKFIQGAVFDQAAYQASFDDDQSTQACFDKEGQPIPLTNEPVCEIRLSYYRVQEMDRNYDGNPAVAGTSFNYVPMSRLLMRIKFLDKSTNSEKVYYLSRLKAHVLSF